MKIFNEQDFEEFLWDIDEGIYWGIINSKRIGNALTNKTSKDENIEFTLNGNLKTKKSLSIKDDISKDIYKRLKKTSKKD